MIRGRKACKESKEIPALRVYKVRKDYKVSKEFKAPRGILEILDHKACKDPKGILEK